MRRPRIGDRNLLTHSIATLSAASFPHKSSYLKIACVIDRAASNNAHRPSVYFLKHLTPGQLYIYIDSTDVEVTAFVNCLRNARIYPRLFT